MRRHPGQQFQRFGPLERHRRAGRVDDLDRAHQPQGRQRCRCRRRGDLARHDLIWIGLAGHDLTGHDLTGHDLTEHSRRGPLADRGQAGGHGMDTPLAGRLIDSALTSNDSAGGTDNSELTVVRVSGSTPSGRSINPSGASCQASVSCLSTSPWTVTGENSHSAPGTAPVTTTATPGVALSASTAARSSTSRSSASTTTTGSHVSPPVRRARSSKVVRQPHHRSASARAIPTASSTVPTSCACG